MTDQGPTKEELDGYAEYMRKKGFSPKTIIVYTMMIKRAWRNPREFLRTRTSRGSFSVAKGAIINWARHTGNKALRDAFRDFPMRRMPKSAPRVVPTLQEWGLICNKVWKVKGPLGALLWITVTSGLRIGDVLMLTRDSVVEAAKTGRANRIHQKGAGGTSTRRWIVGPLAMPGVKRLMTEPGWTYAWQLIGRNQENAAHHIKSRIPDPFTPHCFRHAVATYLTMMKVPPTVCMAIGGWESLSSFERYVNHEEAVPMEQVDEALGALKSLIVRSMQAGACQRRPTDSGA